MSTSSCHFNRVAPIDVVTLASNMNRYFEYALAPSTRSTYRSGLNSYSVFCKQLRVSRFPLQEINLQLFVTSLAARVKYSTIKVYLSGIQYQSITLGFDKKKI